MSQTAQFPAETSTEGAFVRQPYTIQDRITADGSSGFRAEPGRYHLYVSLACPWAHRAIIVRRLLGLEDVISMSVVDPIRDERGWAFRDGPGHSADPVNGFAFLSEAYHATDPAYTGRYTVPCIWDRVTRRLVTNNFPDITIDFETQFTAYHRPGAPDLYPVHLRPEIDASNELIYHDVNNGVYKAGFATTQSAWG
jgi:glutathionyl-hydroquinone reductase